MLEHNEALNISEKQIFYIQQRKSYMLNRKWMPKKLVWLSWKKKNQANQKLKTICIIKSRDHYNSVTPREQQFFDWGLSKSLLQSCPLLSLPCPHRAYMGHRREAPFSLWLPGGTHKAILSEGRWTRPEGRDGAIVYPSSFPHPFPFP